MNVFRAQVTLHGKPRPQGSKRLGQNRATGKPMLLDANPNVRPWRNDLTRLMLEKAPPRPLDAPFEVILRVFVKRPQAHYRTGKHAGELKFSAPSYAATGDDLDKICRAVGDAGTGAWWRDDSRIVRWDVSRLWADGCPEGVEVTCWTLE